MKRIIQSCWLSILSRRFLRNIFATPFVCFNYCWFATWKWWKLTHNHDIENRWSWNHRHSITFLYPMTIRLYCCCLFLFVCSFLVLVCGIWSMPLVIIINGWLLTDSELRIRFFFIARDMKSCWGYVLPKSPNLSSYFCFWFIIL